MQIVEVDGLDAAATARAFRQAAASELVLVGDWGPIEETMLSARADIADRIIRERLARNLMRWELTDTIIVIGSALELAARGLPDRDGDARKTVQSAILSRSVEASLEAQAITGDLIPDAEMVELGALWATAALRVPCMYDDTAVWTPASLAGAHAVLAARPHLKLLGFPPEALRALGVTS